MEHESTGDSGSVVQGITHSHKKRKVSPARPDGFSDAVIIRSRSPGILSLPSCETASSLGKDTSVTSKRRSSPSGRSTIKLRKLDPSTSIHAPQYPSTSSSNFTTPAATPFQDLGRPQENGATGSSPGVIIRKSKPEREPSKSLLKTKKKGSKKSDQSKDKKVYAGRTARESTSDAKVEAEKAKRAQNDQEKLMTPLQYAAILQDKWHTRVSNTAPERLFLKNKVIFLIFEEQNKSTKDTRIKLDIVSNQLYDCYLLGYMSHNSNALIQIARSGGQVATLYDPETVTHVIPGGSTVTLKKTLRALGLRSLSEIPPNIHTVNWSWIVSGLSVGSNRIYCTLSCLICSWVPERDTRL